MNSTVKQHKDINYLVLGLGVTGFSVAVYLLSRGYRCRVHDSRDLPPYYRQLKTRFAEVQIFSQKLNAELIGWADTLVVSPGLSIHMDSIQQAQDLGKSVIGDIELFAQAVDKPVIAITGSNGKSTVTTLLGEVMRADSKKVAVGGNIGVPALDLLEQGADYYVLELSSYQLETTESLKPLAASVLNLSEDHLDRYDSYADYVHAKLRIYEGAKYCISNFDDETTRHDSRDILFSLTDSDADFSLLDDEGLWLARQGVRWVSVGDIRLKGRHNWANCLAAMALADSIGVSREAIVEVITTFCGIAHRSQWIAEINGVEWINDSKATNVGAAKASIEGCDRPVILIAGGQSKGADMSVLNSLLQSKVKDVLLLGEDADLIEKTWRNSTKIHRVETMKQAVQQAQLLAQAGDCVLLAPACASFDMYPKFEARGDDFADNVRGLTNG
ncbi:MAG: UDP-N-acetylmuramoyl-L-alanine--D-glutamate ligase [Gammaproteobacteria bacterium]|nr:UDP-N-acetylmuramoyl-L-alanine--D-glutamate ligase [Gammaproteobacteria bacterium]